MEKLIGILRTRAHGLAFLNDPAHLRDNARDRVGRLRLRSLWRNPGGDMSTASRAAYLLAALCALWQIMPLRAVAHRRTSRRRNSAAERKQSERQAKAART